VRDLNDALQRFHKYRRIFFASAAEDSDDTGDDSDEDNDESNEPNLTVPRQHSMVHYPNMVEMFAAPNGLCTSITEAKHKSAVKEPWRRSNHHDALAQVLLTNQRLTKLSELRKELVKRGLLKRSFLEQALAERATMQQPPPLVQHQPHVLPRLHVPGGDDEWFGVTMDDITVHLDNHEADSIDDAIEMPTGDNNVEDDMQMDGEQDNNEHHRLVDRSNRMDISGDEVEPGRQVSFLV
jgi:hypothetical protein